MHIKVLYLLTSVQPVLMAVCPDSTAHCPLPPQRDYQHRNQHWYSCQTEGSTYCSRKWRDTYTCISTKSGRDTWTITTRDAEKGKATQHIRNSHFSNGRLGWDSNPWPSALQATLLPTKLLRQLSWLGSTLYVQCTCIHACLHVHLHKYESKSTCTL